MLSDTLTLADIARLVENPTSEAALAALSQDPPYPMTKVLFVQRESLAGGQPCRVAYRGLDEDGAEVIRMATLGLFLLTALQALVREEGWSAEVPPLSARLRDLIAVERAAPGGDCETLSEWAMGPAFDAAPLIAVSALRRAPMVAL